MELCSRTVQGNAVGREGAIFKHMERYITRIVLSNVSHFGGLILHHGESLEVEWWVSFGDGMKISELLGRVSTSRNNVNVSNSEQIQVLISLFCIPSIYCYQAMRLSLFKRSGWNGVLTA